MIWISKCCNRRFLIIGDHFSGWTVNILAKIPSSQILDLGRSVIDGCRVNIQDRSSACLAGQGMATGARLRISISLTTTSEFTSSSKTAV